MGALNVIQPAVNSSAAATSNIARIQALLDAGGDCALIGSGIVWINDSLRIGDNTILRVDPRLEIKAVAGTNKPLLVSKCYAASWASASIAWTAGLEATLTLSNHGLSKGNYVWVRGVSGTTDTAFFGTFVVKSVTDANNVVLALRVLPEAAPTGTIQAKRANQNVSLEGGTWNYNLTGGNGSGDNETLFGIVLAGIANLRMIAMRSTDAAKYCVCIAGINGFTIEDLTVVATNSDGLKIYGPSWDGSVRGLRGNCGDDGISVQTEESAGYTQYNFAGGGSCLAIDVDDLAMATPSGTAAASVYPVGAHRIDNIAYRRINQTGGAGAVTVRLDSAVSGVLGTISLSNIGHENADTVYGLYVANSIEIKNLEIDGFVGSKADVSTMAPAILVNGTAKIHRMGVRRFQSINKRGNYNIYLTGTATVDLVEIEDSYIEGSGGTFATLLAIQGATVGDVLVKSNRFLNVSRIVDAISGTVGRVMLENNSGAVTNAVQSAVSTELTFRSNRLSIGGQGMVRANGAAVVLDIKTDGSNKLVSGAWFTKVNGAETLNVRGDDVEVDISAIARFDSARCYNTNAALGTLGAAGRVTCQGTSANSWRLLADTTKQY